ncbi:MAG: glycerate kinase, partial [Clostridiales bacterium]|nr:glycerate kinase [Clostridiales bacterium]
MMRIMAAMDSFKGSLTSVEAAEAVRRGILSACPDAEVLTLPIADGGEGTV